MITKSETQRLTAMLNARTANRESYQRLTYMLNAVAVERYAGTWDESKHPRADDGEFGQGAGSQAKPAAQPGTGYSAHPAVNGVASYASKPTGSKHVKLSGGSVKLSAPKTAADASAMLAAMNAIHQQAQADLEATKDLPANSQPKVLAMLRAAHVGQQLNRAVTLSRPFAPPQKFSRLTSLLNAVAVERYRTAGAAEPSHESTETRKPAKASSGGWQKVGGASAYVVDGKVVKGCPGLMGEHLDDLEDEPDESRHERKVRQDPAASRNQTGLDHTPSSAKNLSTPAHMKRHAAADEAAKRHGLPTHRVLANLADAHTHVAGHHAEREAIKERARKLMGLNARDIARMENGGKDHSSVLEFDTFARDMADEFPQLNIDPDSGDAAPAVWDLLREGKQAKPAIHHPDVAEHAAAMAKGGDTGGTGKGKGGVKHPLTEALDNTFAEPWDTSNAAEDQFAYFSRRRAHATYARLTEMLDRYAAKKKPAKGQKGMSFDEEDVKRDELGQFAKKEAEKKQKAKEASNAEKVKAYQDAVEKVTAATKVFQQVTSDYRSRKIGDAEYLSARKAYKDAEAEFDAAYEEAEKHNVKMPRSEFHPDPKPEEKPSPKPEPAAKASETASPSPPQTHPLTSALDEAFHLTPAKAKGWKKPVQTLGEKMAQKPLFIGADDLAGQGYLFGEPDAPQDKYSRLTAMLNQCVARYAFSEADHPRGQPGNAGEFAVKPDEKPENEKRPWRAGDPILKPGQRAVKWRFPKTGQVIELVVNASGVVVFGPDVMMGHPVPPPPPIPPDQKAGLGKKGLVQISKVDFHEPFSDDIPPLDSNENKPIIVQKTKHGYDLIDGFGRVSGLKNAGRSKVHAILVTQGDIAERSGSGDDADWVKKMHARYAPGSDMGQ